MSGSCGGGGAGGRDGVAEAFGFEGGDEPSGARQPAAGSPKGGRGGARQPLGQGVVVGIGGAAHAEGEAVGCGEILEVGGGGLDATIAVGAGGRAVVAGAEELGRGSWW